MEYPLKTPGVWSSLDHNRSVNHRAGTAYLGVRDRPYWLNVDTPEKAETFRALVKHKTHVDSSSTYSRFKLPNGSISSTDTFVEQKQNVPHAGAAEQVLSPLGQRLQAIRVRIVDSGVPLLTWSEIEQEREERRGG